MSLDLRLRAPDGNYLSRARTVNAASHGLVDNSRSAGLNCGRYGGGVAEKSVSILVDD
ncbi:hypothetical protein ACIRQP_24900 [Streptomyces sp. NPDC102274]|uniref:hypothetical protein n=1 Tax=Streptomyces sp. NPDC102274 TaxID=3366151 RepID=UPI00380B39F5